MKIESKMGLKMTIEMSEKVKKIMRMEKTRQIENAKSMRMKNLPLEKGDRPCVSKVVRFNSKGGRRVDNVVGNS